MWRDALEMNPLSCQDVELAVVGLGIDPPETRPADVSGSYPQALARFVQVRFVSWLPSAQKPAVLDSV